VSHKPLTLERARELAAELDAARRESEALREYLTAHRQRLFWPDRRRSQRARPPCAQPETPGDSEQA
jgi:hypothetical protein